MRWRIAPNLCEPGMFCSHAWKISSSWIIRLLEKQEGEKEERQCGCNSLELLKKGKRKRRKFKAIERRADGVCVSTRREYVKRVRRPVQASLMANTDISGRPACAIFSLRLPLLPFLQFPWPLSSFTLQAWIIRYAHICVHTPLFSPPFYLSLYLSFYGFTPLSLFLSLFVTPSSVSWCIWRTWAVERQQTSNRRSVWASVCACVSVCVCVCVVWGRLCATVVVPLPADDKGNCASSSTKSHLKVFSYELLVLYRHWTDTHKNHWHLSR